MTITSKDMLKVFITEVSDNIRTIRDVEQHAFTNCEPNYYEVRTSTQIGGVYWTLRALSINFSYNEGNDYVRAMDTYFDKHCKAIIEANEMIGGEE